jgi:hypothetical protein
MTLPEAYGSNKVTDEVTASVDADNAIKGHSFLLNSKRRERFSVVMEEDGETALSVLSEVEENETLTNWGGGTEAGNRGRDSEGNTLCLENECNTLDTPPRGRRRPPPLPVKIRIIVICDFAILNSSCEVDGDRITTSVRQTCRVE